MAGTACPGPSGKQAVPLPATSTIAFPGARDAILGHDTEHLCSGRARRTDAKRARCNARLSDPCGVRKSCGVRKLGRRPEIADLQAEPSFGTPHRQLAWTLTERSTPARFLIRDRDSKFTRDFDTVFRGEGIEIIKTPVRAPKANAIAERFVRTVRSECLDWLLIVNRRHLEKVLRVFVHHYNGHRPHRSLNLTPPNPAPRLQLVTASGSAQIERHDRFRRPHPRIRPRGVRTAFLQPTAARPADDRKQIRTPRRVIHATTCH